MRSSARAARRCRRSATTRCCSSATSSGRATSRSRSSATRTATSCTSTSASARSSAATRRSSRRRRRRRSTPKLRAAMGEAAVALGKRGRLRRRGHGRVHRRLRRGTFYFLEVNTRLQVEHPVTECIDRARSRARADPHRARRAARLRVGAGAARLGDRGPAVRRGSPSATTCRRPARCSRSTSRHRARRHRRRRRQRDRHPLRLDARQDHRARADAQRSRAGAAPRARADVGARRHHEPRAARRAILAHPAFLAGELHTHFLEHHAGELARAAARASIACASPRSPRRSPAIAAPPRGAHELAPPGWRNVRFADQACHLSPRRSRGPARLSPRSRRRLRRSRSAARPRRSRAFALAAIGCGSPSTAAPPQRARDRGRRPRTTCSPRAR